MRKSIQSLIAYIVAAFLVFNPLVYATDLIANPKDQVLHIKNEKEFMAFVKATADASYSENLSVSLDADLNLRSRDFSGIPSFSGIFEGNNHTIRGVKIERKGSAIGFFRYIETAGVVKNLSVKAKIIASGTAENIGGIVGVNCGKISLSSFDGTVEGINSVGGIAGKNCESGRIISSTFSGKVYGDRVIGGIAGRNEGLIEGSKNTAKVNTRPHKREAAIVNELDVQRFFESGVITSVLDIGGIAGLNLGRIMSSKNIGEVGYPHTGYNVGGIAGRQSGYIRGSVNEGAVYGKKDVGGIVGQAEPDVKVRYRQEVLEQIGDELDGLKIEIDALLDHIDGSNSRISGRVDSLLDAVNTASDDLEEVYDGVVDFSEDTADTFNDFTENIDSIIDDTEPIIDDLGNAADIISDGFGEFKGGLDAISDASDELSDGIDELSDSLSSISDSFDALSSAFKQLSDAVDLINKAVSERKDMEKATAKFKSAISYLNTAIISLEKNLNELRKILEKNPQIIPIITTSGAIDVDNLINRLPNDVDVDISLDDFNRAFNDLSEAVGYMNDEINKDSELIDESTDKMSRAMLNFSRAMSDINDGVEAISEDLAYFSRAFDKISTGMDEFYNGTEKIEQGTDKISDALNRLERIAQVQSERANTTINGLDDYISKAGDELFDSLSLINTEFEATSDELSSSTDELTDILRTINDRIFTITDLIQDGADNFNTNWDDIFVDDSIQKIAQILSVSGPVNGLMLSVSNSGKIDADENVGGIAGSMAVEVEVDPDGQYSWVSDSEIVTKLSGHAAIVRGKNFGSIVSKRDNVGGVVGNATVGIVMNSENYGNIESTLGSYVGGIAGYAEVPIRESYAMSKLTGLDYLGGIAGRGADISSTKNITQIVFDNQDTEHEAIGAVAGYIDLEEHHLEHNYFVSRKLQGVDSISYKNGAQWMTYEAMIKDQKLPSRFKELNLTFIADDKTVAVLPFEYGEAIDTRKWPEVPPKSGTYGKWQNYDYEALIFPDELHADYREMIQTLSSSDSEDEPPVLLVEGFFTDKDSINAEAVEVPFNQLLSASFWQNTAVDGQWHLTVDDKTSSNEIYRYHIRMADNQEHVAYLKHEDGWVKLDAKKDGSYLVFDSNESDINVTLVKLSNNDNLIRQIGIMVVATMAIIFVSILLFSIIGKRRKNKSK